MEVGSVVLPGGLWQELKYPLSTACDPDVDSCPHPRWSLLHLESSALRQMSPYLPVLTYLLISPLHQHCHFSGIPAVFSLLWGMLVCGAPEVPAEDREMGSSKRP